MRKKIFILFYLFTILLGLSSCTRSWIIDIDGYVLHKINGNYYIAQLPEHVKEKNVYEIPTYVGEYPIYGFGSGKPIGIWAGYNEIKFGFIRKIIVKNHVKSIEFNTNKPLLIETERPLSEINWNPRGLKNYQECYFLSPLENYDVKYVDETDCYDGIIYEIKNDGFAKVLFNYSNEYIIHNQHKNIIVNEIGSDSFSESNIKEIIIPSSITIIGNYAFYRSTLESVEFNENLEKVCQYAFADCSLKELNLPNIELTIEDYAFENNNIIYIEIPEKIKFIGNGVFRDNDIQSFNFKSEHIKSISINMFYGCPLTGDLNFGTYINEIKDNALSNNERTELIIPDTISYMGNLSYCDNLRKIYLPNTSIRIGTFTYLKELEELHLGGAENFDDSTTMSRIEKLKIITVSDSNNYLYTNNGILYDKNTNAIIKCPPQLDIKKIEISVKPYKGAFIYNKYIEEAIINCEISECLFSYCDNLKKVQINCDIKTIPNFSFMYCTNLKEINLNNILEVGENSFYKCTSLNYVDLSNCEIVGGCAFEQCDLYEVIFTTKIIEIKHSAFSNNKNLKKCNYYNANVGKHEFYNTLIK